MLMPTLSAGLLIPKDERKRPQRDENSPEISLDFPCLTAAFSRNSSVARYGDALAARRVLLYQMKTYFVTKIHILQDVPNVYK